MFDFNNSLFQQKLSIPLTARIVFVSDMFVDDYVGGAELTSEALIKSSPFEVFKLHSKDVTMELLQQGVDRFWVFGNFANLDARLIPSIVGNIRYSILEYDYKYCRFRSPEKHLSETGKQCDCQNQMHGKMISAFFHGSMGLWWMSEAQKEHYHSVFPFLTANDNVVLSSVLDSQTISKIRMIRSQTTERKGWIVLGSNSWVKGAADAEQWCKNNNKDYQVVWNLPHEQLLERLGNAEGFVYLPKGMDTCPRMVMEAKLLGCKLQLNPNVQHKDESWFNTDDIQSIEDYILASPKTFWNGIKKMIEYKPTISGYTTTYNCVSQGYPFVKCIESMLKFCDEVCIVDGGSTDSTIDELVFLAYPEANKVPTSRQIMIIEDMRTMLTVLRQASDVCEYTFPDEFVELKRNPKINVKIVFRDWNHPRFAVFDGMQKAEARSMCTGEFCWQMDSDEVVHEDDAAKISDLARAMPKGSLVIALPVIEYWGGPEKVRLDVTPWKWRLSRNSPDITHGVPSDLRIMDSSSSSEGPSYYAAQGTDGCDMIFKSTQQRVPFVSFYNDGIDNLRKAALLGDSNALKKYEEWFNSIIVGLPSVFHYSWYDLPRKIKLYRGYWTKHWNSLYGKDVADTAENNMMFDAPWSSVTDEMIEKLAIELKEKIGGWIWHRKWTGAVTPHIICTRSEPKLMRTP